MLCFSSAGDAVKQPCTAALKTYQSNVVQPFIAPTTPQLFNYSPLCLIFTCRKLCLESCIFFFMRVSCKNGRKKLSDCLCLPLFLLLFSVIKGSCPCSMPLQDKLYIHINISTQVVCKTSVHAVVFFSFHKV